MRRLLGINMEAVAPMGGENIGGAGGFAFRRAEFELVPAVTEVGAERFEARGTIDGFELIR